MTLKENFTGISFLHYTFIILFAVILLSSVASAVVVVETVQITNGVNQGAPAWSHDGNKIVFSSGQAIWVMNADGSNQKQVFNSVVWDGEPCFNADGSKIYFASEYVSPIYSKFISIHVVDSDGYNRVQLTKNAEMRAPAVSPDGSTVAYISKLSGSYDIWTMDANGSNNVRLTDAPADEFAPAWSPDGKSIVYSSEGDIWTTDRNGILIKQLTDDEFNNADPFFSPDGSKIVFGSDRSGTSDIWLMNSNGTGTLQITSDFSEQKNPAWSPDGEKIVYVSNENGNYNIWVMSLGNTDTQIEYNHSEDVGVDEDVDNIGGVIEEILGNNLTFVIVSVIIIALLFVIFIIKMFIRSL
ncbi:MAG: DUF5050 domain-containing protein [Methanosarcinaceae archaeon]|nr:DUF5050 domain-containing protein [Methanosarcinaceae archaeon]